MERNDSFNRSLGKKFDYKFKIILIGDPGTGKTCLASTFSKGRSGFSRTYITTKVKEIYTKPLRIDNTSILLEIWDLSGADDFRTVTTYHYTNSDALMVVYSLTSEESWLNVPNWLQNVESYLGSQVFSSMRKMLVATKADSSQRVITDDRGRKRAAQMPSTTYMETSAKEGYNVQDAFHVLARDLFDVVAVTNPKHTVSPPTSPHGQSRWLSRCTIL